MMLASCNRKKTLFVFIFIIFAGFIVHDSVIISSESRNFDYKDDLPLSRQNYLRKKPFENPKVSSILTESLKNDFSQNLEILIVLREYAETEFVADIIRSNGEQVYYVFKYVPIIHANVSKKTLLTLEALSVIEKITPNYGIKISELFIHNEGSFKERQHIDLLVTAGYIRADEVRSLGYEGKGVKIGILDTGINDLHPMLEGKVVQYSLTSQNESFFLWLSPPVNESYNDLNGHGTFVASIAGGNDGTYKGIAPQATLYNLKVLNRYGEGKTSWLIQGIEKAIELDLDVINLSIGEAMYQEVNDPLLIAVEEASMNGIITVAAAGNYGPKGSTIASPAVSNYAIAVGANWDETYAPVFTSVGPRPDMVQGPDVLAPGVTIKAASASYPIKYWETRSGTSASAPHVAGAAALLLEAFPSSNFYTIKAAMVKGARDIGDPPYPPIVQGSGLLDVKSAYDIMSESLNIVAAEPKKITDDNFVHRITVAGTVKNIPLVLVVSYPTILSLNVVGSVKSFVELSNTSLDCSSANVFVINALFSLPNDARMLKYEGSILINDSNTNVEIVEVVVYYRYLAGRILFDFTHENEWGTGIPNYFMNNGPNGKYSMILAKIEELGYRIETNNDETLTQTLLGRYDILVISDPEIDYSSSEIESIHNFVTEGGSLLVMSFNSTETKASSSINMILKEYGIYVNDSTMEAFFRVTDHDLSHDIFKNVPRFNFKGTFLTTDSKAQEVAWIEKQEYGRVPIIALFYPDTTDYKKGRVLALAGDYPMTNDAYQGIDDQTTRFENLQLSANIFEWLIEAWRVRLDVSFSGDILWWPHNIVADVDCTIRVKISHPNSSILNHWDSVNCTITGPDDRFYQVTLKQDGSEYVGKFKPKRAGDHYAWIQIYVNGTAPNNALTYFSVTRHYLAPTLIVIIAIPSLIILILVLQHIKRFRD